MLNVIIVASVCREEDSCPISSTLGQAKLIEVEMEVVSIWVRSVVTTNSGNRSRSRPYFEHNDLAESKTIFAEETFQKITSELHGSSGGNLSYNTALSGKRSQSNFCSEIPVIKGFSNHLI